MDRKSIVFENLDDRKYLVSDQISGQKYAFVTDSEISMTETDTLGFPAPLTRAVDIETGQIVIPEAYATIIRNVSGTIQRMFSPEEGTFTAEEGCHYLEISAPVKTYVEVQGQFSYGFDGDQMSIQCEDAEQVTIGARSSQIQPQEKITVSESVTDLIDAVSYFGGAMMTDSPERSFPTLRDYPPGLELGDELAVPDSLDKPETDLTITVPPDISSVLTVSPLAYYLLADIDSGAEFTVRSGNDVLYRQDETELSAAVKEVLQTSFFMDCLVRTEGLYPVDLYERSEFDSRTTREWEYDRLYDASLETRVQEYLRADYELIEDIVPRWPITAVVEPGPQAIETLSYLMPQLPLVNSASPPRYTGDQARMEVLQSFSPDAQSGLSNPPEDASAEPVTTRSTSMVFDDEAAFVDVPETDSRQTLWLGEDIPLNAADVLLQGFRNQQEIASSTSETLSVTVVCNDRSMRGELDEVGDVFDPRGEIPIDVKTVSQASTAKLREILTESVDYLHFIGHATPSGLECPDGTFDTGTLASTGVRMFCLNACQSYNQGVNLVNAGSVGGIATYTDISDTFALETAGHIVQLLNYGFQLGACHNILAETTSIGNQYTVVGNPGAIFSSHSETTPNLRILERTDHGFKWILESHTGEKVKDYIGSLVGYNNTPSDYRYLVSSATEFEFSDPEPVRRSLESNGIPIVVDGRLERPDDVLREL